MPRISAKGMLKEARRRRVFRTAGLYIVGAWVAVQIALSAFPALSISDTAVRYVWLAALLGFPAAMIIGWRYDIRNGRILRTSAVGSDVPLSLQRADFIVLAAISVVTLVILVGSLREITNMEPSQVRLSLPSDIDNASVAVLPFVNMSADPNNEYFSDGLTETLLHMLSQLADLKVAARTSSFAFKGQNADIRSIALALGVAHVLEGSVQKDGDRVRVTAQLIRADDGFHVWSQNYDRMLDDIFAIQDEIAADVASSLGSSLLAAGNAGIRNIETEDFSAYDIYLKALEQQNINTNEALLKGDQLFAAALDKDPEFVDAKIGLARNYMWKRWKGIGEGEEYRTAQTLINEVLAQSPDNLSARVMHLLVQWYIGYAESKNWAIDETLELLVDDMLLLASQGSIGSFLTREIVEIVSERDREEEALDLLLAALEKDPLNIDLLWAQANLYRNSGRPQDAKQPLLTALKLAPDNPELYKKLGELAHDQEDFVEAMDWFRQAVIADPEDPQLTYEIARKFYVFGLVREADLWFDRVRSIGPDRIDLIVALEITSAAAAQDQDRLLEVLERALPLVLSREVNYFLPTVYYPSVMSARGRSQQALDHLTELIPDLQDYSKLIDNSRFSQYLQLISFGLQGDVLDEESFKQLAASFLRVFVAAYPDFRDNLPKINVISVEVWLGNHDGAKQVFLEAHADWPMFIGQWLQFQIHPWLEDLRNDPEVASALEEYRQKKARIADELREMLKRPEWRH